MSTFDTDLKVIQAAVLEDEQLIRKHSMPYARNERYLKEALCDAIKSRIEKDFRLGSKNVSGDIPRVWREMEEPDGFGDRHILKVIPLQDGGTELAIMVKKDGYIDRREYCVILKLDSSQNPAGFLFPYGCGRSTTYSRDDVRPLSDFTGSKPISGFRGRQAQFLLDLLKID